MIKREEPSLDKQVDGGTSGQGGEHRRGVRQRGQVFHFGCAELQVSVGQPSMGIWGAGGYKDLELWPGERFIWETSCDHWHFHRCHQNCQERELQ